MKGRPGFRMHYGLAIPLLLIGALAIGLAPDSPKSADAGETRRKYDKFFETHDAFGLEFGWGEIPALMELARDGAVVKNIPASMISSYAPTTGGVKGMVALGLVETIRRQVNSQDTSFARRMPFNFFCLPADGGPKVEYEASVEQYQKVLAAYQKWWEAVKDLPPDQAAKRDPLADVGLWWYGADPRLIANPTPTPAAEPFKGKRSDGPVQRETKNKRLFVRQEVTAELDWTQASALDLENNNGNVTVTGSNGKVFHIVAKKEISAPESAAADDLERRLGELKVELAQRGNALEIRTVSPSLPVGINAAVNYEIQVPRTTQTKAATLNGNVAVSGLAGQRVAARSRNGNITARDMEGWLSVETNNGNIEIAQARDRVLAVTSNGNITCRDVSGESVTLNGNAGNTDIVQTRVFEQPRTIQVRRQMGQIRVTLPEDQPFTLDAQSALGSIGSDFPVKIEKKGLAGHASGTVGRGGPMLKLQTQTGSIEVRKN